MSKRKKKRNDFLVPPLAIKKKQNFPCFCPSNIAAADNFYTTVSISYRVLAMCTSPPQFSGGVTGKIFSFTNAEKRKIAFFKILG
jgi:hypothetical protein